MMCRLFALLLVVFSFSTSHANSLNFSTFEGAPIQGLSALILDEVYSSIDIPIKVTTFPGRKSLMSAHIGIVDGEVSRLNDEGKGSPNLVMIPESINFIEAAVFTKNIDIVVTDWESLRPYLIGIPFSKEIEQKTAEFQRIMVPGYPQLFRMLSNDQIEVVVCPLINGLAVIGQYRLKHLKPADDVLVKTELFHYLHKKHEHLVPQLTEAIRLMKRTGQIDHIRQRFIARMKKINR